MLENPDEPLLDRTLSNKETLRISKLRSQPAEMQEISKTITVVQSFKCDLFEKLLISKTLQGHADSVFSVAFSPDGKTLVSGSLDNSIKVWNLAKKREDFELKGHSNYVYFIAFSPDGKMLASGSADRSIKLWSFAEKRKEFELLGHANTVFSVAFSPDGKLLASGSADKSIKIWNLAEKCKEFELQGHLNSVFSVAFSPNGKLLASGSADKSIKIWNLAEQSKEFEFQGHSHHVLSLAFSPDGKLLASGSADKRIKIWNLNEKHKEAEFQGHSNFVRSVAFSHDGKLLASGSDDNTIKIWSLAEKREELELQGHSDYVFFIAFSPDSKRLASGSADNSIKVWNLAEKHKQSELHGHSNYVYSVAFSFDSEKLASGSADNSIKVWNVPDKREEFELQGHSGFVYSISFSPDGKLLASGSADTSIKIWDLTEKRELFELHGHSNNVLSVAFSPDGRLLASGSDDKSIKLWNLAYKREEFELQGHSGCIWSIAFSPDCKFLASGSYDLSIKIWNLAEQRKEFELQGHSNTVFAVAYSPDGKLLASGSADKSIKVWNLIEKREEFELQGHSEFVWSVAFSPDGNFLATGSADKSTKVWNLAEKREEFRFHGHSGSVRSVAFSSDGKLLASGSQDGTIKVINVSAHSSKCNLAKFCQNACNALYTSNIGLSLLNDSASFDQKGNSIFPQSGNIPEDTLYFDPNSLADIKFQGFLNYYNALCMVSQARWMKIRRWDILISNLKFTPLHLAAFSGATHAVQEALKPGNSHRILADEFGHSPIHYSIMSKHQDITDTIVDYIAQQTQLKISSYTNFHAIRNDFIKIIQNSPKTLCNLLNECFHSTITKPKYGEVENSVQFINSAGSSFSDFLKSGEAGINSKPLRIKVSWFRLPSTIGSKSSVLLYKALFELKDTEAFNSQFIRYLIRFKWDQLKLWIYLYTSLLWVNLLFIWLILSDLGLIAYWAVSILMIFTNLVLILWEVLQSISEKLAYFSNIWNWIDIFRASLTIFWPLLVNLEINSSWLVWLLVLLNAIRGLTGFRAFDNTRYYMKLIFESVKDVSYFLMIFFYATLGIGLLRLALQDNMEATSKNLWINSFGLAFGGGNSEFDKFNLQYLTFLIAVVFNVIIMLNMIISIFGDSFDKFQLLAHFYSSKEMIEIILALEHLASLKAELNEFKFIHIAEHFYKKEIDGWKGKIIDSHEMFTLTNNKIKDAKESIKGEIMNLKEEITVLKDKVEGKMNFVNDEVITMKGEMITVKDNNDSEMNLVKNEINTVKCEIFDVKDKLEDKINFMKDKIISMEDKIDSIDHKLQALFDLFSQNRYNPNSYL